MNKLYRITDGPFTGYYGVFVRGDEDYSPGSGAILKICIGTANMELFFDYKDCQPLFLRDEEDLCSLLNTRVF